MGAVVGIPVTANAVGDEVRVRIATVTPGSPAPGDSSPLWTVIGAISNGELPGVLLTPPRPPGTRVWYQAASFDAGFRVSNWSAAADINVPWLPGLLSATLTPRFGSDPSVLVWAQNLAAGGIRIRWSVDPIGAPASLSNSEDVDATDESFDVPGVVPIGSQLNVELEPWSEFDAGAVAGDPGPRILLEEPRTGAVFADGDDAAGDLACRVYMDEDLELYVMDDIDYCLVTDPPGGN